jgi:predicted dehydrogenase
MTLARPRTVMTRSHSRRQFLHRAAAALAFPALLPAATLGREGKTAANSRINLGVIGVGNRAQAILPNFMAFKELQVVAVSDCRADRMQAGKKVVDAHYGNTDCRTHPDFLELLAQSDVDAVLIATGNRWHGLASIYAARAGKDVYSEKPVTLTIGEGRTLVDTCRRFGTIYQAGTQRRATESYRFARDMVRQGRIGHVHTVEMQVWTGPAIPADLPVPVPAGWDYDRWLGQVPWIPFTPSRVHNWQYFWDTAEGILTDMGCHYTDQMQWALGRDLSGPVEFEATGEFPDPSKFCSDTPITATARCRYNDGVQGIIHQRGGFTDRYIRYVGDEGWIQVDDETDVVTTQPKSILNLKSAGGKSWADAGTHIRDFLNGIRSRTPTQCNAEVAHRAITICQAMNLSLRLGRRLKWDPVLEQFDLPEANRMMWREPRSPWRA